MTQDFALGLALGTAAANRQPGDPPLFVNRPFHPWEWCLLAFMAVVLAGVAAWLWWPRKVVAS